MAREKQLVRYQVRPIGREVADEVRAALRAPDYGHPVHAEVATGPAPCRVCLEKFVPGQERRLLLTYDPFRQVEPEQPLPGPVFIHETSCIPLAGEGLPATLANDRLTLSAYGEDRALIDETRTATAIGAAEALERFFANGETQYVHARSTPNGCFLCQLDRAETD